MKKGLVALAKLQRRWKEMEEAQELLAKENNSVHQSHVHMPGLSIGHDPPLGYKVVLQR